LFKAELRFVSANFNPVEPICYDHTPIFENLVHKIGGLVETRGGERRVLKLDGDVVTLLARGYDGSAGLVWYLRGGPRLGAASGGEDQFLNLE